MRKRCEVRGRKAISDQLSVVSCQRSDDRRPMTVNRQPSTVNRRPSTVDSRRLTVVLFSLLTFHFSLLTFFASAQNVSAAVDREQILLGEQITLQLKAEGIHTDKNSVTAWFNLPDTVHHLEVVKRSPVDTLDVEGAVSYLQTITLTSFDSGKWILPALHIKLQNGTILSTDSFAITVLPVDVSNLQQYHPIKDIIPVEVTQDWRQWIAIAAGIIIAAILIYLFIKRKKKAKPAKPLAAKLSLFEDTIAQLEALEKEELPPLLFYTKLDTICRHYMQEQLGLRAKHLTQDELLIQLNVYVQQQDVRIAFYQLLRLISAVKFAKYAPPPAQNIQSIGTAKNTVQYIHQQLQRTIRNNV